MKRQGKSVNRKAPRKFARAMGSFAAAKATMRAQPARGINSTSVFQPARRTELKFCDLAQGINVNAGAAAGTASSLINQIAQGVDAIQHVGREISMKSLYWTWTGDLAPTTTGASALRLVIVYDKESNGAVPTIATGAVTDIFNEDTIGAKMNLNNRDRFIVLVDEVVENISTSGPSAFYRKGYRKISLPVVYNASAASTIAAIQTGGVFAVVWQNAGLGTAGFTTTLDTRIRFEDA